MDQTILLWLNGLRNPWLDGPFKFLSDQGLWLLIFVPLLLLRTEGRSIAPTLRDNVLAFFVSLHVNEEVLKSIVQRKRPTAFKPLLAQLHVLGSASRSPSFPSGTAAACAAATMLLWCRLGPRHGVPAALVTFLISLTRCYVGAHWPSDLLGGWISGALLGYAVHRITESIDKDTRSKAPTASSIVAP